jgi:calcineurin-like phosphoesterase family protein
MREHWITADLHLGHANISRYSGRPFSDPDDMDEAIVESWNTTVGPTDRVLILGDVALGKITDSLSVSRRLHGHKILLAGNHDRCAAFHGKKAIGWEARYMDEGGFAEVHQGTMRLDLGAKHRKVLACHFPYVGDTVDVLRYSEQRPIDKGEWLVHGHVHDSWLQAGRQINVSLDAWGGRITNSDEVVAMIDSGPREQPRIDWPT